MEVTAEVKIADERIVTVCGDPRDIFAVVRALQQDGHDAQLHAQHQRRRAA